VRLPGGLGFDRFAEQMRQGQTALAERRYFDAEEQFSRALVSRPGDAAAMGGRINAQIGAGMYRSAAVNLRQLIAEHPEVAGVQYQGPALPALDRMTAVSAALRENLELGRLPTESALLLAYVGHQLGDAAMAAEGLDAYAREAGSEEAALVSFLRAVWLGREAP
jgi:thioredoxin-like negative regulator of GroEL